MGEPGATSKRTSRVTSKDRIYLALRHKEADRVPFDLGSCKVTGIHVGAYRDLTRYLGLEQKEYPILDVVQRLAEPHEHVLQYLGVDTRGVWPGAPSSWSLEIKETGEAFVFVDEWGITWKMPKVGGHYYDIVAHPLSRASLGRYPLREIIEGFSWPNPDDPARTRGLGERASELANASSAAIVATGLCAGFMEMALRLCGFEEFLTDLAVEPELACILLDRILDLKMEYWDAAIPMLRGRALVVVESEDLGAQNSTLISPATYRKYIKPRQHRLFSFIKKKFAPEEIFIMLHSCGSVYELIPDFIEAGVDILNPVQVRAAGMDTRRLKRDFGDSLTFWGGGVDTQEILPRGTPRQVKDEVRKRIDDLAPGGGFVFCAVHNIQEDVPPENIMAMLEAVKEYGFY